MKCLVLLCLVAGAFAAHDCPANSHYNSCGTACPVTCDNYQNPPKFCILICNPGCHCDEGYVKNSQDECVKPEECHLMHMTFTDETCGENESFKYCGTACPKTCENMNDGPSACPAVCKIGCQCDEGYVRANNGKCVTPENCPSYAVEKSCQGKGETGLCRARMPMWYYSAEDGKCHKFIYGGCGGNGNKYATEEECMQHCEGVRGHLDRPDCDKKGDPGMCKAYMERFYYDQEEGMCKKFVYGGCGGNRNNFASEFECYNKCGALAAPSACQQEKVVGNCRGAFPRYFFNKETGKCEYFIYGGCGGNDNNFNSAEDCQDLCEA